MLKVRLFTREKNLYEEEDSSLKVKWFLFKIQNDERKIAWLVMLFSKEDLCKR